MALPGGQLVVSLTDKYTNTYTNTHSNELFNDTRHLESVLLKGVSGLGEHTGRGGGGQLFLSVRFYL